MTVRFDSLDPGRGGRSFRFEEPRGEIVAWQVSEVIPALEFLAEKVGAGFHAAGFIGYEAAPAFDSALTVKSGPTELPLLWFGIFARRVQIPPLSGLPETLSADRPGTLRPSLDAGAYTRRIRRILDLIAAGDSYQVNLTMSLGGEFHGNPLAFYRDLARAQRSAFCAYLEVENHAIISASPELFFRTEGERIEMRPMKGTRPRGRWVEEDDEFAENLLQSAKDQAENLMIVDLLRNDLGRVSEYGSVRVPTLFEIEKYPTVHQLTSTITSRIRTGQGLVELFRALFPSGSVTGAPKVRTSQIIAELEDSPRGPYTGAIGFVSPTDSAFSVAIRTAVLNLKSGNLEVGVGSGITADSDPEEEYQECLAKGAFLYRRAPDFELLETLRLDLPGDYTLLDEHLERMRRSADYFGFEFEPEVASAALKARARQLAPGSYKVRLLARQDGSLRVEASPLMIVDRAVRLGVSDAYVDPSDIFLYHKTTHRSRYDAALAEAGKVDDVILVNQAGELTETTTANLVLSLNGELVTPPIECGLLPGIRRGVSLRDGLLTTRILKLHDLERADEIHLVSSVRGWRRAILVQGDRPDTMV